MQPTANNEKLSLYNKNIAHLKKSSAIKTYVELMRRLNVRVL